MWPFKNKKSKIQMLTEALLEMRVNRMAGMEVYQLSTENNVTQGFYAFLKRNNLLITEAVERGDISLIRIRENISPGSEADFILKYCMVNGLLAVLGWYDTLGIWEIQITVYETLND